MTLFHLKCISLNRGDWQLLSQKEWYCFNCTAEALPFIHIENNVEYINAISETWNCISLEEVTNMSLNQLNPFELNDSDHDYSPTNGNDPDVNYFNNYNYNIYSHSKYFSDDIFNKQYHDMQLDNNNQISLLHLNIRSVQKNLSNLANFMELLDNKFQVIGLTETWFYEGIKNIYNLDNYNLVSNCRKRKRDGGVALYLDKALQFRVRKKLNIISDALESIFIEIDKSVMQTKENVIIGTIYRPPNTDMDEFLEQMTIILESVRKEKKICYIMGDFNINLLNIQRHKPSNDFYNLMESFYLFPLIIKPTRITESSATLIDNIFTNNINTRKSLSGLFLTDISDHVPIFTILEIKDDTQKHNKYTYITGRNFSEQNIKNFQDNLNAIDWSFINNHDTQGSFSLFHASVMSVYNDCFPNRTVKLNKYQSNKRWLTVGLKASIKKEKEIVHQVQKTSIDRK